MYEVADRAIKDMNRRNLRAFDHLKQLKFDSLNVLGEVTKVYDNAVKLARVKYLQVAIEAFITAVLLALAGIKKDSVPYDDDIMEDWVLDMLEDYTLLSEAKMRERIRKQAEKIITDKWVTKMLKKNDPVVLYQFLSEAERKKHRLIEALSAVKDNRGIAANKSEEIDKALKLWTIQTAHFADKSVDEATAEGFMAAGIEEVKWIAVDDNRTCSTCYERDGEIYPLDEVPPKPHLRCRCEIVPA